MFYAQAVKLQTSQTDKQAEEQTAPSRIPLSRPTRYQTTTGQIPKHRKKWEKESKNGSKNSNNNRHIDDKWWENFIIIIISSSSVCHWQVHVGLFWVTSVVLEVRRTSHFDTMQRCESTILTCRKLNNSQPPCSTSSSCRRRSTALFATRNGAERTAT